MNGNEALNRLKEGNKRFLEGKLQNSNGFDPSKQKELAKGQSPFAAVLGCADSRVPPEIIFDQGPGDLFVGRVAGNIVDANILGSLEFAVKKFNVGLIVVLGHSNCGAVQATLDETKNPSNQLSEGLQSIVNSIAPSVKNKTIDQAIHENISNTVKSLTSKSTILKEANGNLVIAGAVYSLDSGQVHFL